MARLADTATGRIFVPGTSCLVGRSPASQLVLAHPWVSGQHATIRWSGANWELRDLGSKNGTFVGDRRIPPSKWTPLMEGDTVGFGRQESPWTLQSASPPAASAWLGEKCIHAVDELLALPSADRPLVCIYRSETGIWVAEDADSTTPVEDGERVEVDGDSFLLNLPIVMAATRDMRSGNLGSSAVRFRVSRDQEHITMDVIVHGETHHLPHRAHHELLLYLANARLEDARTLTAPASEHGWRYQDDVARALRIPPSHFNMTIYRARQQLRSVGFDDADAILERRRGSGQLRIGIARLEVQTA